MARLIVMHDTDPDLFIELTQDDDGDRWEGPCSDGDFDLDGHRGGLRDAVEAATIHLDHQH